MPQLIVSLGWKARGKLRPYAGSGLKGGRACDKHLCHRRTARDGRSPVPVLQRQNDGMPLRIVALDHVQLAMPVGGEAEAEAFYRDVLGFAVLPKPEPLASRGGRWFASGNVHVHLGVEDDFRPARKAHPALVVEDFDDLIAKLDTSAATWRWNHELPGTRRLYVNDPFGNRIELIDSGG